MTPDPLGLVYNKQDNTGAAVVIPSSHESVTDYYLKQDAVARKRADFLLDKSEGKVSTSMSKFWDKDKAYAAELRNKYVEIEGKIRENDPLLKKPESLQAISKARAELADASHLSQVQEKIYLAKVQDITKYPDLYQDRDAALKALDDEWANQYSPLRPFAPKDERTMRAPTTDVFKYIKTLRVPTKPTSKPVDIGGGVIKQVDSNEFDESKSENEAHLMLADSGNKFSRRLLSMANDYVETNYPAITDDKQKSIMATEWATQHYVEIQRNNWDEYNKQRLQNKPKGNVDSADVRRVGDSVHAGQNVWKYRTDQTGREIFTFLREQKTGEPAENKQFEFLDKDGKTYVKGIPKTIENDPKKGWYITMAVPIYKQIFDKNVLSHYERKEVPYIEENIDVISGEFGLTPLEVKAKLGLSPSVGASAAPDKIIVKSGKQDDSEIKKMRDAEINKQGSIADKMKKAQELRKRSKN